MASVTNLPAAVNEENQKQSAFRAFADILSAMTDFSILNNKQMLLICIGNIFSMLGYYLPIMCLVSFAHEDHKVDQTTASYLMSIFGKYSKLSVKMKIRIVFFRSFQYNRSIRRWTFNNDPTFKCITCS